MHVRQERVSAIERAKVDASELRTLAAYVAALGGCLDVVADFGGERLVVLRQVESPSKIAVFG